MKLFMQTDWNQEDYTASFQRGEEPGFTYYYNDLSPRLTYHAFRFLGNKEDAEDVVQVAFIKIWERHSTFYHYNVIKAWLYTTVENGAKDKLRKRGTEEKYNEVTQMEQQNAFERSPLHNMIITEVTSEIHDTLKVLPPECRKIVEMSYLQGKSVREIAEALELSISTVKNQRTRGLEILRKKYPHLATIAVLEALRLF